MTDHYKRYKSKLKEPVIIPYNVNNKLIRDVDLKEILNRFGIKLEVVDIELYRQALTHKSYIKKEFYNKNMDEIIKHKEKMGEVLELRDESNERLEFFGDTVIKAVILESLNIATAVIVANPTCAIAIFKNSLFFVDIFENIILSFIKEIIIVNYHLNYNSFKVNL